MTAVMTGSASKGCVVTDTDYTFFLDGGLRSHGKYRVWENPVDEFPDFLASEMKHVCQHCGETRVGEARETILWFREHVASHGVRLHPLRKKGRDKMEYRQSVVLNAENRDSREVGRENSAMVTRKHTRESLLRDRDEFVLRHGRLPVVKDAGWSHRSQVAKVLFGSFTVFKNWEGQ